MSTMKNQKPFMAMNDEERAAATAEFDREMVIDETEPLTLEMRAKWERAKRKRGRPKVGGGAKVVSVSLERGLLERADRAAKRLRLSRAQLVARGLRAVLAAESRKTAPARKRAV